MIKRFVLFSLIIIGCSKEQTKNQPAEKMLFNEVDNTISGLNFSNDLNEKGTLNIIEYLYYYNGGGVALGDINNDGLDDIYLTANQKPDKLYLNEGNLKFKDISLTGKINQDSTWSTGVTMVDINNDGFLDIYISRAGDVEKEKRKNELFINNGDLTFTEQAAKYGLDYAGYSSQSVFLDYDKVLQ